MENWTLNRFPILCASHYPALPLSLEIGRIRQPELSRQLEGGKSVSYELNLRTDHHPLPSSPNHTLQFQYPSYFDISPVILFWFVFWFFELPGLAALTSSLNLVERKMNALRVKAPEQQQLLICSANTVYFIIVWVWRFLNYIFSMLSESSFLFWLSWLYR